MVRNALEVDVGPRRLHDPGLAGTGPSADHDESSRFASGFYRIETATTQRLESPRNTRQLDARVREPGLGDLRAQSRHANR